MSSRDLPAISADAFRAAWKYVLSVGAAFALVGSFPFGAAFAFSTAVVGAANVAFGWYAYLSLPRFPGQFASWTIMPHPRRL